MKLALITSAALGSAFALAACNPNTGNRSPEPTGPGQTEAVNAAQDATAGAVGQVSAATLGSLTTDQFVPNAARSGMWEIQSGELAMRTSHNAELKRIAQMIITDHRAAGEALARAVRAGNVNTAIPTDLDERRQGVIDNLRTATGADFDRSWVARQIDAHSEALTLLNGFAERGDNDVLKAFAREAAPTVQRHLDALRALDATIQATGAPDSAPAASAPASGSGESH